MNDRRARVLQSILTLAALGGGMPIGLGVPREALLLPDDDLPPGHPSLRRRMGTPTVSLDLEMAIDPELVFRANRVPHLTLDQPVFPLPPMSSPLWREKKAARSPTDQTRRNKRKAERRARKRR